MFCFIFCFPDAQKYTNEQYLVISQWYMDVSVLKVAASGARPAETILRRYGIGTLRYANRP